LAGGKVCLESSLKDMKLLLPAFFAVPWNVGTLSDIILLALYDAIMLYVD
jgi:hypothetical protein